MKLYLIEKTSECHLYKMTQPSLAQVFLNGRGYSENYEGDRWDLLVCAA